MATEAKGSIEVWSPAAGVEATVATGQYRVHTSWPKPSPSAPAARRRPLSTREPAASPATTGLLVDAAVGPLALLRTMAAVDDDTAVYVVADRRTAGGDAAGAGTVVLPRSVGAVVLEVDVRPGE